MRRGRGSNSGAGRGGSSFVRRKKLGCPPRKTAPAEDAAAFFPLRVRAIPLRLWFSVFGRLTRSKDFELPTPGGVRSFDFPVDVCCRFIILAPRTLLFSAQRELAQQKLSR